MNILGLVCVHRWSHWHNLRQIRVFESEENKIPIRTDYEQSKVCLDCQKLEVRRIKGK